MEMTFAKMKPMVCLQQICRTIESQGSVLKPCLNLDARNLLQFFISIILKKKSWVRLIIYPLLPCHVIPEPKTRNGWVVLLENTHQYMASPRTVVCS